jgi:hypothetical protein
MQGGLTVQVEVLMCNNPGLWAEGQRHDVRVLRDP